MKNILTITKKELLAFFNNPTAYIIILAFLMLWEFLFFRNVFLIGEASLRSMFGILPWILLIVIPALTMGALAEEKNEGTLEFLLTHPINQLELIAGKFFGILSFFALAMLFVFPLAFSIGLFGNLDWGQVVCQYLAGVLTAAVLVSIGIFISSLFTSQISAFLVSVIGSFFLIIAGTELVSVRLPLSLAPFLEQLSVSNHFDSMSRGVIDLRDVWYFISFPAVFLGLTYLNMLKNKYGNKKAAYRNYQTAFVLLVGIVILSNVVGARIPGRIDLTEGRIYTLTSTTKELASNLPDIVNITLYASDQLPAQYQPVLRDTKDILNDYQTFSQGKIKVAYKNPSADSAIQKEAISKGVQPMRFNIVSKEEFQAKEGYLGIAVSYGGENEAVPFVGSVNNLEYELSGFLKKLTTEKKPKVGFLAGHGEKSLTEDYSIIEKELEKQFALEVITAQSESGANGDKGKKTEAPEANGAVQPKQFTLPEEIKTLIIAGPVDDFSDAEKKTLTDFIAQGGSVLFLIDGVTISDQTMTVAANQKNPAAFVKEITGVEINKDLVYDLRSNKSAAFSNGVMQYILPYPFLVVAPKAKDMSPITAKIENLVLPWASSLTVDANKVEEKGYQKNDLFVTTANGGAQTSGFNISPDQKFSSKDLNEKLLAVALSPKSESTNKARIIILGNSNFLSDRFIAESPVNFAFALDAISWLSQEASLSSISVKNLAGRKLTFENDSQPALVKFGNLAFVFLATSGYGAWRLTRRKKMKERKYAD